jgi:hypothetical protein
LKINSYSAAELKTTGYSASDWKMLVIMLRI